MRLCLFVVMIRTRDRREGTSKDDAGIISRDIMMCRVAQLEWLSTRFFVKNAK